MPLWKKFISSGYTLRRVHVLVVDDAADRRLVHADGSASATSRSTSGREVLDAVIRNSRWKLMMLVATLWIVFCRWSTDLMSHSADRNLSFTYAASRRSAPAGAGLVEQTPVHRADAELREPFLVERRDVLILDFDDVDMRE